ncbi:MAG: T9SS type A sorting domain-containing protein [Bacteroidia bacterium]|nr:T9SS type A sorting domain-containing protein [Bacteroidia bacterium]
MKKLLPALLVLLCTTGAFAQSGGPDAFGYTWRDSNHPQGPAYNWIDIVSRPDVQLVTGLTDDNTSSFYQMGFSFPYYWYSVSQYKVGANGYIIFSNGNISSPFPVIPSTAQPHDYIAAFMSDLNFNEAGNPGRCYTWTNSVDSLVVSYVDVPFWINAVPAYTGSNSFQIILSAVDSSITFQYMLQQGTSPATTSYLTIGIENSTGAVGLQHSQNTYPAQSYAIKYYYPPTVALSINDASAYYNNNAESGGLFLSKDGNPFIMTSQIKNTGNQTLPPFNVNMRILNNIGATVVQENIMTDTMLAGATQDLTATLPFNLTTAGTYTFRTTTQLTGDATITNNEKLFELIVVDTTQVNIPLGYTSDAPVPVGSGISWSGGNSGVGVEIVPPFYPCFIRYVEHFIAYNTNNTGFYSLIYDNSGPDNGPGVLLDSVHMPSSQVFIDSWNTIQLATPIRIDSGSVFVEWRMEGADIGLGTDNTLPIGNRSYETLGAWAIFRYREDQDPMIRVQVSTSATADIKPITTENIVGEFYPTPTQDKVSINVAFEGSAKNLKFSIYNLQGQLVQSTERSVSGTQRVTMDVSSFEAGVYICTILEGENQYNRKFVVQ